MSAVAWKAASLRGLGSPIERALAAALPMLTAYVPESRIVRSYSSGRGHEHVLDGHEAEDEPRRRARFIMASFTRGAEEPPVLPLRAPDDIRRGCFDSVTIVGRRRAGAAGASTTAGRPTRRRCDVRGRRFDGGWAGW